ncbi:MAG: CHAT domain-containing tetratricopeptide repeat protein, partial [candidate division Zixibacteria bacterium]
KYYRQAEKLAGKNRHFLLVAQVRRALTEAYMYLGQYKNALESGRRSLNYFQRNSMTSEAARMMTNVGNVYHRMDNNRMALRYYDRAREIFAKEGGTPLATVDYNRGNILTNLNRTKEAARLYSDAAAIYSKASMPIPETMCRYSIAYLHFVDGHYAEAFRQFEGVLDKFVETGEQRGVAVTQLDLAELNLQINQYGSAVMHGEEAVLALGQLGMRYEQAKAEFFIAMAANSLGDRRRASRHLNRAEKLFVNEKNNLWLGMVAFARSRIHLANDRPDLAIKTSAVASKCFMRSKDERRMIDADLSVLEASLKTRPGAGTDRKRESLKHRKLSLLQQFQLQQILGEHFFEQEKFNRALPHYRQATKLTEKMASGLLHDEIRFFFVADKYPSYSRMIQCLLEAGRTEEAMAKNFSALSLLNQPSVGISRIEAELSPDMISAMDRLRSSISKASQHPRPDQRRIASASAIKSQEEKLWTLERKARSQVLSGSLSPAVRADKWKNLDALPADRAIINFLVAGESVIALIAEDGKVSSITLPLSRPDLNVTVRKLQFLAETSLEASSQKSDQSAEHFQMLLRDLHNSLIAPLLEIVTHKTVTIVVDGIFGQIPFSAMVSDASVFLKDSCDLSIAVNPDDLIGLESSTSDFSKRRNATFAVVSDTLPAVRAEGDRIAAVFPTSRLFTGNEATSAALRQELSEADGFVHVAAHSSRSSENPLYSRILMTDGPFFPFDLLRTGVAAELVTLSGCQTAAPGLYYGNSFSLAKAFYQAGSRYVLATLWPVSDRLTEIFMSEFYMQLKQTGSPTRAYADALRQLQTATDHPASWAAFVLIGV